MKALKEAGVWTAEHDTYNQNLIKRQDTLAEAWAAYVKSNPAGDEAAFAKGWMAARKDALVKAGFDPIFE